MTRSIEQRYFEWLCSQIDIEKGRNTFKTYGELFELLYEKQFVWTVPNDGNRVQDGLALRAEFAGEVGEIDLKGVSILEVLIGISRRIAFVVEGEPGYWAWQLLENLKLDKYSDPVSDRRIHNIENILETWVWRTYDRDGTGGLFPLAWPNDDQTKVEIWYQMHAYLDEQYEP